MMGLVMWLVGLVIGWGMSLGVELAMWLVLMSMRSLL